MNTIIVRISFKCSDEKTEILSNILMCFFYLYVPKLEYKHIEKKLLVAISQLYLDTRFVYLTKNTDRYLKKVRNS